MRSLPSVLMLTLLASGGPLRAADEPGASRMPQETIFSKSLRFTGDVVEVLPSGKAIRKNAFLHGRAFTWRAKVTGRVATPESEQNVPSPSLDLDAISLDELAENLRALVLFNGHEFIEAEPAYGVARKIKLYHQLEREGASEEELGQLFPGVAPSPGRTPPTGLASRFQVHGADDRAVMPNTTYPHTTQIVFDNAGSNSAIESSQGSGSLIGPSTALSAAHVFWDETNGTWEATHRWAPGFDSQDADPSPWGDWTGCYVVAIPLAYTTHINQNTYDYAVIDFDVGCNSVDNGVNSDEPGSSVGWLGAYVASSGDIQSATGFVRGYPGTGTCGNPGVACNVRVWGDTSSAAENNATANEIHHQADTSGGMSGSGFYQYDPPCGGCTTGPYLVGIHRAGSASYNVARRFDSPVFAFMENNSSDY